MIQSLTETHQLESGSETQFWALNWEKFQHTMTLTWVSETLKMFHNNQIHIDYQITTPKKLRHNDRFIMDVFMESQYANNDEITRKVNWCRMWLKALRLSDITDVSGRYFPSEIRECSEQRKDWISPYNWPHQQHPTEKAIETWKQFLFDISGFSHNLQRPLGQWIEKSQEAQWFTNGTIILVKEERNLYRIWTQAGTPRRRYYQQTEEVTEMLLDMQITFGKLVDNKI